MTPNPINFWAAFSSGFTSGLAVGVPVGIAISVALLWIFSYCAEKYFDGESMEAN